MSYNFGSASTAFGSTTNKPTAFGSPLSFGTPATTASTGFGGFGSTFGAGTAQQPSAFGTSTFGQPAAGATAPAFGSTFGQTASAAPAFGTTFGTPATSAPAFGSTFGAPATATPGFGVVGAPATSAPAFGSTFGAPAASTAPAFGSAFGASASAAPSLFGTSTPAKPNLFGTPATSALTLFGTPGQAAPNLYGANTTTQAPSLFGGAVTTTTPSLFGATSTTTPSLFGTAFGATTTTTPSLFGTSTPSFGLGTTTAGAGFGFFGGATTTSAPSLFSGFGKTNTVGSSFTGFGTPNPGISGFGASQTAPTWGTNTNLLGMKPQIASVGPVGGQPSPIQQLLASFYAINIFGDERDNILKKWNMLQACWGTGKGYYNPNQPPMEYNACNPFYRYKAIGYVIIPGEDNTHGLVKLIFNKREPELMNQKEALSNGILGILGNKPNLSVIIDYIKGTADNKTEVMFSVSEKGVTGTSRKILASDLCAFLNQPVQKQQLTNVGVIYIGAYITPNKAQLREYLKNPPPGVEKQLWHAAQTDNPNPHKFMPTLLNGFTDLKKRMLCQQHETNLHIGYLNQANKDILELKKKHANSVARINELKQKYIQLHHRLLKVIVKQEVTRKIGMTLQPEEELLKGRLETIAAQLNLPTQYKGQLFEIRCAMNLGAVPDTINKQQYRMDPNVQEDVKQFLKMEQNGISHLVNLINSDLKNLKIISEGLEKLKTA